MIRFGMKLPEIFSQLVRGYRKVTGRDPEGLDLIKIRQESLRRFEDMNKVVDMQGRSIDTSKGIMGGKQIEDVIDDLPPPGSRGGPDDIAAPVMNVEDAPPGFIDFVRKTDPEGADKLQKVEDEIKAAIEAANKRAAKKLRDKKKKKDDPEKKADGGRIGLKKGMDRRTFMKIMGGLTTLPILGKFFKGAEVAAPVAKKAVEVAGQAPSYFFDLVAKIKMLGKPGISIGPRQNTMNYKNYELMEDVSTGDIRVTKQKGDPDFGYEEEVMEYRKGQRTEDGMIPDEYEEATIRPDMDGKMKDIEDGIEPDSIIEIIKEVSDEAPSSAVGFCIHCAFHLPTGSVACTFSNSSSFQYSGHTGFGFFVPWSMIAGNSTTCH